MGKILASIAAVFVALGVSLAVVGCGSSTPTGNKMSTEKMKDDKMKDDKMKDDKMKDDKMKDDKMKDDK